jgi:hypothetical protein
MKIVKMTITLLLAFFPVFCTVIPVLAAVGMTPVEGRAGTAITISELAPNITYTVKWSNADFISGTVPSNGTISFIVPSSPAGSTSVRVENPTGTQVFSGSFKVLPSLSIDPLTGFVGATVTTSGSGFISAEANVKIIYDGVTIKEGITADDKGTWSSTFTVPNSTKGNHLVDASGGTTLATDVQDKTFKVNPNFTINPSSGSVGTGVVVAGRAFDANEANIKVSYDSQILRTGVTADAQGSWNTTFTVPSSTKGSHIVEAYGATTVATDVAKATFSVLPGLVVTPASSNVGGEVKVEGGGFSNNEGGIKVTIDGVAVSQNISADSNGNWSSLFVLPSLIAGDHVVDAYGMITQPSDVTDGKVTIMPKLVLSLKTGKIGDTIGISGTGFSSGKNVSVKYGDISVAAGLTTDKQGNFSANFPTQKGLSGNIPITVVDDNKVAASETFSMETTPPDVPRIISPKDGATIGIIGDTVMSFKWSEVTDPSGVFYELELGEKSNFSTSLMKISNLTEAEYTLTEAEALEHGDYYWRVRAIDGAGNTSAWTATKRVTASYLTYSTLFILIGSIIGIAILIRIIRWLMKRLANARKDTF